MERKQYCGVRHKWEVGFISVESERKIEHRTVMCKKLGYNHILPAK